MFEYQKLDCEKYWVESAKKEIRDIRRQKNREAMSTFLHAFAFLAMLGGTVYAWNQGIFENMDVIGAMTKVGESVAFCNEYVQQSLHGLRW